MGGARLQHLPEGLAYLAGVILVVMAATSHAAIYTWKDQQGIPHYGDRPPPDVEATLVEGHLLAAQRTQPEAAAAAPQPQPQPQAQRQATSISSDDMADSVHKQAVCAQARANVNAMQSRPLIRQIDEDGNDRLLTEAEKAEQIASNQEILDIYCQ